MWLAVDLVCVYVVVSMGVCSEGPAGGGQRPGHTGSWILCHLWRQTPAWVCGWRVPQPGTASLEEGLACRARGDTLLRGASWTLETDCPLGQKLGVAGGGRQREEEGDGSMCSELSAGSRHRRLCMWHSRRQFGKRPLPPLRNCRRREKPSGWLVILGK